jgi:lipopolysaccharide export system ATP-binding protein
MADNQCYFSADVVSGGVSIFIIGPNRCFYCHLSMASHILPITGLVWLSSIQPKEPCFLPSFRVFGDPACLFDVPHRPDHICFMDYFNQPDREVTVLEADSILLQYQHRKVLQNIYMRVGKGEVVGLLGRNGSGKSSLLEVIYGIRTAQNCSVRVDQKFISKPYRQQDLMAYLPQKAFVPEHLKVTEAFDLYEVALSDAIGYFPEIEPWLSCRLGDLSGGQRRLIEMIMVIISCPASFVVLDEPFSHLMPVHIETVKIWLSVLKKTKGFLITDHRYQDVLAISDHLYLLNMGGRTILLREPMKELRDLGYIN